MENDRASRVLYCLPSCPICGEGYSAGPAIYFLRSVQSNAVFIWCWDCGCAWRSLDEYFAGDKYMDAPKSLAPTGVKLPTLQEIVQAGFGDVAHLQTTDDWHLEHIDEWNSSKE